MENVEFDITNQMAVIPAKAGRSLDERTLLQSFKAVNYHRPVPWLELTLMGTPTKWNNKPAFKVEKPDRIFLLSSENGQIKDTVLEQYQEAVQSGKKVKQVRGRVAGWELRPEEEPKVQELVVDAGKIKEKDAPPLLLLLEFEMDDHP